MAPTKINFKIYQGSTFKEVLRWESPIKNYALISGITKSAPMVINAVAHGIPVGWRFLISGVLGMTEVNSDVYYTATTITVDTVTVNAVNSLSKKDYISGGVLEYNVPVDLTAYTARMQIRAKLEDEVVIHELTTELGSIILDTVNSTITLNISAAVTAAFTFSTAVYSVELISGSSEVIPFCNGTISLVKEVTR